RSMKGTQPICLPVLTTCGHSARLRAINKLRRRSRGACRRRMPMPKRRNDSPTLARRNFLKGAGLVGPAALTPAAAQAQAVAPKANLKAAVPGPAQLAADTHPPTKESVTQSSSGGDFMVDVFKSLDIDYLAMNCASSFRGLHEAVINY